jgi:hypothetical protein
MPTSPRVRSALDAPWEQLNARRLELIDKKYKDRLSAAEEVELRALQEAAEKQIELPPIEPLLELRERAIEEGLLPDPDDLGR